MNSIKLYNTLSKKKEEFKPIKKGEVGIYNCGPTVYDTPHIGNYRTFVMDDLIRRVFEYDGYKVRQVMNITDVDDKTIRKSREANVPLKSVTAKYEELFLAGLKSLNILMPENMLRATDNIPAMTKLIGDLVNKGFAYVAKDGVYLHVDKVKNYGELAGIKLDAQDSRERITNDEYDKENTSDFALWKFKSAEDGDAFWPSSFGEGRPGWHIECSAMSMEVLGSTIDIHTGGIDLMFPHHTNEIAQSESATGATFVNYWVHGGFMTIADEKMSKSKGNFIKIEDLIHEDLSPISFRYWLLTAHYRSPINFTKEAVQGAQNALIRFIGVVSNYPEGGKIIPSYKVKFEAFIYDDFDTAKAIALSWDLLKDSSHSPEDKRATILDFDRVFGLGIEHVKNVPIEAIPDDVIALAEARQLARTEKDWVKADALRLEIESRGYEIKDTSEGYAIRSKSA